MISASGLVLDGHHGHDLGPGPGPGPGPGAGGPHHMAFVDPYLRSKLPGTVPEFLCPLPKPAPIVPRFNNQRTSPSHSPELKSIHLNGHPTASVSAPGPVNLTSAKHEGSDSLSSQILRSSAGLQIPHLSTAYPSRMFPPPGFHYSSLQDPYGSMYPSSYPFLPKRPTFVNSSSLSPLERQYSPPQSSIGSSAAPSFLQPPVGYPSQNTPQPPQPPQAPQAPQAPPPPPPPPPTAKPSQSLLGEKRPFKIPPGKEVNGKQRVLPSSKTTTTATAAATATTTTTTTASGATTTSVSSSSSSSSTNAPKRGTLPVDEYSYNNNYLPPNFRKGSLIQTLKGELKRIEDITTEELVMSAERCAKIKLDLATVIRIEEKDYGMVLLTLSYGEPKKTIDLESKIERPYFLYGQGWASCSPEQTMVYYGLECHRLEVGHVCLVLLLR